MLFSNLQSEDWNFVGVDDDELFACLVYEYGRESRSFMYAQEWSEAEEKLRPHRLDYNAFREAGFKGEIPRIINTPEERAVARESLKHIREVAGFDIDAFLEAFWNCDEAFIEIFEVARRNASPYSAPWLLLPRHLREQVGRKARHSSIFAPLKQAWLGDLERLWKQNAKQLLKVREMPELQRYGDEEDCELYTETTPVIPDSGSKDHQTGELIVAFAIDFQRFSNAQIVEVFKEWLTRNRPTKTAEPIQRGKKQTDARAALEWLGIMRALHFCSWRDPRFPTALKTRGELGCYKARKRARQKFHELFPFLPTGEDPNSWPTAAESRRRKKRPHLAGSS